MTEKFGPVLLAPGVKRRHVACYLFAAAISIGMFTYLMALTPYILTVNLGIPEEEHGRVMGNLQFWQEIVVIACIGWWGAMSDRFGRRAIYIIGFLLMMTAYGLYAFASSLPQLFAFRMVFALAVAATTTNLSAILADYPQEQSRGKMTGMAFVLNGLGAAFFLGGLSQLPDMFQTRGVDDVWAGRYAYLFAASVAFVAAIVMTGLKPGRPEGVEHKAPVLKLIREGLGAVRNRRIGVAYLGAFAARADMAIITLFVVLWAVQASQSLGLSPAEAQGRAGMLMGVSSLTAVVWAPIFGVLADRIDRMKLTLIGFSLGAAGYGWLAFLPDVPTFAQFVPALIMVGIGQSSTALASMVLLGQEAPVSIRGSVFGVQNFCGAVGILAMSSGGGYLFDLVGPQAPFVAVAVANFAVVIAGVVVRSAESRQAVDQPAA